MSRNLQKDTLLVYVMKVFLFEFNLHVVAKYLFIFYLTSGAVIKCLGGLEPQIKFEITKASAESIVF